MKWVSATLLASALVFSAGAFAQPYDHHDDHGHQHDYQVHRVAPARFRGNDRVVSDYGHYHLRRPPRGYHWVRGDDGDFLLVAATTGVIASIIASSIQ